jgi:condensin-2 complex subunit D3
MYDLLEVLRDGAISDDKASVRRAALIALVDLHILGISVDNEEIFTCSINEQDVAVISAACQDTSLTVRRAAAEGLTTLIERVAISSSTLVSRTILLSLEKAWATLIIPMVLDSETSCVSKAVELVERLLLLPITSNQDSMSVNHNHIEMATTVAWRILANVGVGTSVGSVRSENDALHKAIQHCMMVNVGKANHQYTESIFQTIHQTAVNSLISPVDNVFAPNISDQRTGVWCLFNSVIGKEAIPKEIIRSLKKSKIDMTFLCTSWDDLLELFLDRQTPQDNKAALQHSMRCCLHILSQVAMLVDCDTVEHTTSKLQDLLEKFVLPPEIIGSAVDAMIAIKIASRNGESRRDQCKTLLRSIYRSCEKVLSSMRFDVENISRVSRILFTIGEVSIVGFSASDDDTDDGSKTAVENSQTGMTAKTLVRGICERPSKQLIEYVQAFMTDTLPVGIYNNLDSTPESVRAHAFVALGKLCLRDVNLAQQSLNVLARELHDSIESKNWAVQSNALIVLGDLCVKYTNMVDRFLPVMASCLQAGITTLSEQVVPPSYENGSSLVRKHAILLLSSLILQDYVKWRGLLFHRFLVASVDENDEVACLAEMVLLGPLLSKQPRLFANQFVESIFVLNGCSDHPIFKAAAAMGDGGSGITVGFDGINLNGDSGRMKRMQMYQMMLSKMSDEDKIGVTARIGKEILGGALKIGSELNTVATTMNNCNATSSVHDAAFNVLSDALSVLQCHQIRVGRSNRSMEDDIEDPNVSTNSAKRALVAKGRLLSNVSRKHLIEILMPILCNLKAILEKSRSPLLKDLMICLLDVYQRHKNEARECLANDPTTLQEIEYDAQQQLKMQRKSIRER